MKGCTNQWDEVEDFKDVLVRLMKLHFQIIQKTMLETKFIRYMWCEFRVKLRNNESEWMSWDTSSKKISVNIQTVARNIQM